MTRNTEGQSAGLSPQDEHNRAGQAVWKLSVSPVTCGIRGDEDCQSKNERGAFGRAFMGEGGVEHDACGVDHGKLVEQLHAICTASVSPPRKRWCWYMQFRLE